MNRRSSVLACMLGLIPLASHAATEWATWNTAPSNLGSTGSFMDGRSVGLAAWFETISGPAAAGTIYSASPAVPGQPDGRNPSFTYALTGAGPYPAVLDPGHEAMHLDLTDFPVNADTILGLADLKFEYRLELQDASHDVLPLTGLVTTNFDLTYDGSALIADKGCILNTVASGSIPAGKIDYTWNDAGGSYTHTGLCTFGNLPADTRFIRLVNYGAYGQYSEQTEGIHVLFGGTASAIPIPATAPLLGTALVFLGTRLRRRTR